MITRLSVLGITGHPLGDTSAKQPQPVVVEAADTHDGGPVVYDEVFYLRARKDLDRLKRERRRLRRLIKETVSPVSEQPTARETVPTPESRAEPFLYENKLAAIEARIAELGQLIAEIKRLQAEEDELVEILLLAA